MLDIVIIIVNYNTRHYLTDCVKSILKCQPDIAIIVVDNHSTDNSIELLETTFPSQSNLQIIKNTKNLGFSVANNIGIKNSQHKYILLLNPDCIIKPGVLEKMFNVMEQQPQAGMAGCLIKNLDKKHENIKINQFS